MKISVRATGKEKLLIALFQAAACGLVAVSAAGVILGIPPMGMAGFISSALFLWGDNLAAWLSNPSNPERVPRFADVVDNPDLTGRTRPVVLSPGERSLESARTRYFASDDPNASLGFLIESERAVALILAEAAERQRAASSPEKAPDAGLYSQALYSKLTARAFPVDLSSNPAHPTGYPLQGPEDERQGVESAPCDSCETIVRGDGEGYRVCGGRCS